MVASQVAYDPRIQLLLCVHLCFLPLQQFVVIINVDEEKEASSDGEGGQLLEAVTVQVLQVRHLPLRRVEINNPVISIISQTGTVIGGAI